jgi:hypothetical protein
VIVLGPLAKVLEKCPNLTHFSKEVFTRSLSTKILIFGERIVIEVLFSSDEA